MTISVAVRGYFAGIFSLFGSDFASAVHCFCRAGWLIGAALSMGYVAACTSSGVGGVGPGYALALPADTF